MRFSGQLIKKVRRTESVESFRFEKKIDFFAGQFLRVMFDPDNPRNNDLNKYLSFSCSPRRPYIEITKRITESGFSQKLSDLAEGDEVIFNGPFGEDVFSGKPEKLVFLVGGIGITPVIAVLENIVDMRLKTEVNLFYSSRCCEEIAFKKEIDAWSGQNDKIRVMYFVSEKPVIETKGVFAAKIDSGILKANKEILSGAEIFVYGPPQMVTEIKSLAEREGIDKIRTESFTGY